VIDLFLATLATMLRVWTTKVKMSLGVASSSLSSVHSKFRRPVASITTLSFSSTTSTSTTSSTLPPPALSKVLIANRGEIACRVIRTCRTLGIPTVALYSVADGPHCLHAKMADEAYQIGTGPSATESYLRQDDVLELCLKTGAQAIHPGYGFLSENATFAQRVLNELPETVVFIGPSPKALTAMGSKSESKAIMEAAGVPTTPGYYDNDTPFGQVQDPHFLLDRAKDIGFPVLIKAVMGGGGKGMRLVQNANDFLDALQACQRESLSSFGDDRVLLEKYLIQPRHVEVQVIADTHGNVVHLYERDCSLQRRHQKIIEEAPASDLSTALRQQLGEMGTRAAQAVGYVNAGTVEFLLDTQSSSPHRDPSFYFCEMNTRLQVEHPITELITGIDLVEWQLRIAAGEPLPTPDQSGITCSGHAMEARIYAEHPARNFLPATGTVWHHTPPAVPNSGINTAGIRVDTGIQTGQEVGVYYDPMICKLIVHDTDRSKALQKLIQALKSYQIAGVPTNIEFLVNCASHPIFQQAGAVNTGFLDDYLDDVQVAGAVSEEGGAVAASSSPLGTAVGVFASLLHLEGRRGISNLHVERQQQSPWSSLSGSWTMGHRPRRFLKLDNDTRVECISHRDGSFDIRVVVGTETDHEQGEWFHVDGTWVDGDLMEVVVNRTQRIKMTTVLREIDGTFHICMWPQQLLLSSFQKNEGGQKKVADNYFWQVQVEHPQHPAADAEAGKMGGGGSIKAPMPGKISRINHAVGTTVQKGDILLVMEAMKMEHAIKATTSGILTELKCRVSDVVKDGAVLAIVTEEEGEEEEEKE
jgi:3-methylcrotonyl-CoA carboxylase alpha subunit